MQCDICRNSMKEYNLIPIKYSDGREEMVVNEYEPIYYIYKDNKEYKCCGECWRRE